jgi:hypothetical protein
MASKEKTIEDLISEVERPALSAAAAPQGKPSGGKAPKPAGSSSGSGPRWLLPLAVLVLGFGGGWTVAGLKPLPHSATATKPGKETRQDLLAAGWQESDQGVFTRRCQDNCRRPMLYGGGMADVMEVNCLERPCGEIRAEFVVLDARGQEIAQITERRPGRQGERLQLVIESQLPEAHSFVLQAFSAKARLD